MSGTIDLVGHCGRKILAVTPKYDAYKLKVILLSTKYKTLFCRKTKGFTFKFAKQKNIYPCKQISIFLLYNGLNAGNDFGDFLSYSTLTSTVILYT